MSETKRVSFATFLYTRKRTQSSHVLYLPKWFFDYFDLDKSKQTNPLLLYTVEGEENELRVKVPNALERMVEDHIELYLNGQWKFNPPQEEIDTFLEMEELRHLDPPRTIRVKGEFLGKDKFGKEKFKKSSFYILNYPFSRLTEKELKVYLELSKESSIFLYETLIEKGMSKMSSLTFVKKCLELKMIKEIEPIRKHKVGRARKRFKCVDDFPLDPKECTE